MKILKLFYPWIIVASVLLAVFYYIFIWQKMDSTRLSIRGEVESIKKLRGSFYDVEVSEGSIIRHLSYSFKENEFDINIRDSILKEKGSKILYIKSYVDGKIKEANYQDYLLGR